MFNILLNSKSICKTRKIDISDGCGFNAMISLRRRYYSSIRIQESSSFISYDLRFQESKINDFQSIFGIPIRQGVSSYIVKLTFS